MENDHFDPTQFYNHYLRAWLITKSKNVSDIEAWPVDREWSNQILAAQALGVADATPTDASIPPRPYPRQIDDFLEIFKKYSTHNMHPRRCIYLKGAEGPAFPNVPKGE